MIKFLDLPSQYGAIKSEIDEAIRDVIDRSAFISSDVVTKFESEFANYQQSEHCIGVGNGTDALEIAIEALGLPVGSEIIVPANSFIASGEAVTRSGHKVVFADIDPVSYTLDPDDVARRITENTAAIMAVHLYGHPCDMDKLLLVAKNAGLKVIEDCSQAHGAEYRGRRVGAIGDVGTFSFYPGKNLGAYGDGGAITTNDQSLAKRCRMIANHGRIAKYDHEFEGRNSRLDGIQAAILSVKLQYLDDWLTTRRMVADVYAGQLRDVGSVVLPSVSNDVSHAFHLYVIRVAGRDGLTSHLNHHNIKTGIHYPVALPKLSAYRYLGQQNENMLACQYDSQLLSIPIGDHLSVSDANTVAASVSDYFSSI